MPATARIPFVRPARWRFKSHPLLLDFGFTGAAQVSLFVSNLLLISLFARFLSAAGVAEYLLLRRVVIWLQSGVQLGLFVGIPRYVAYETGLPEGRPENYFAAGAACLAVVGAAVGLILNLWGQGFSRLLFGSGEMSYLILPVSLMLLGLVLHTSVYGYFRGRMQMNRANLLQIWDMALVPVLALLLLVRYRSVAKIVNFTGVAMIVTAMILAFPLLRRLLKSGNFDLWGPLKKLLTYGIARVPGDFAAAAIFALGPIIAAQFMPVARVSPLLLGTSVLMAASVSMAPVGVLLLSKISTVVAQNRLQEARAPLRHMTAGIFELSLFMTFQFLVFADVVLRIWVGTGLLDAVPVVRIIALAIPGFLFFTALRSVIDAATVKASNAHNILIALVAFLVLTGLSVVAVPRALLLVALSIALVASVVLLAALTAFTVRRLCQVTLAWKSSLQSLAINLLFLAIAIALRAALGQGKNPVWLVAIEGVICVAYLLTLMKQRPEWLKFIFEKGFARVPQYSA